MLDSWAPVGSRNVNTIRSHPNAFTIRNRKETRKRYADAQNRQKTFADFKVNKQKNANLFLNCSISRLFRRNLFFLFLCSFFIWLFGFFNCASVLHVQVGFGTAAYRLQPWSSDLELIEGKCGSGITSYFIFLRRLISLNLVLSLISLSGLILPFFITKQLSGHAPVDSDGCDYPAPVVASGFLQQISLFFAGQDRVKNSWQALL